MAYSVGTNNMVIIVDTERPLSIVMPSGLQLSEPSPPEKASGISPTKVVIVVMRTGLKRSFPPNVTASSIEYPRARSIAI
jgi:hypothetical protein